MPCFLLFFLRPGQNYEHMQALKKWWAANYFPRQLTIIKNLIRKNMCHLYKKKHLDLINY